MAKKNKTGSGTHVEFNTLTQQLNVIKRENAILKQQVKGLKRLACIDSLTKVGNRRSFDKSLSVALEQSRRHDTTLGLLMLDLNDFKFVNETYNHAGGDEALKRLAYCLNSCVRATDTISRLGGDEFAIVLPMTALDALKIVANRIYERVCKMEIVHCERSFAISVSIGGISTCAQSVGAAALTHIADVNLFTAKEFYRADQGKKPIFISPYKEIDEDSTGLK